MYLLQYFLIKSLLLVIARVSHVVTEKRPLIDSKQTVFDNCFNEEPAWVTAKMMKWVWDLYLFFGKSFKAVNSNNHIPGKGRLKHDSREFAKLWKHLFFRTLLLE